MSAIRPPRPQRAPALPHLPGPPKGAPKPPPAPKALDFTAKALQPYDDPPPEWGAHSLLEWIVWSDLVKRGWKIFGRPNVPGRTLLMRQADAIYQDAVPAPGLNIAKNFFRADFVIVPGKRGPNPGPPYQNGIILDPITDWTHRNAGQDRLRRGILAGQNYLLVWLEGTALMTRPHGLITKALFGGDDSSIDRGQR